MYKVTTFTPRTKYKKVTEFETVERARAFAVYCAKLGYKVLQQDYISEEKQKLDGNANGIPEEKKKQSVDFDRIVKSQISSAFKEVAGENLKVIDQKKLQKAVSSFVKDLTYCMNG